MLKKAIFDMDGLIFDTERLFMKELSKVMAEEGYTLTEEIYTQTIGLASGAAKEKMCRIYGNEYPFEKLSAKARLSMEKTLKQVFRSSPGFRSFWKAFAAKGQSAA